MPEYPHEIPDSPRPDWCKAVTAWRNLPLKETHRFAQEIREREIRVRRQGNQMDDDFYDHNCRESTTIIPGPAGGER